MNTKQSSLTHVTTDVQEPRLVSFYEPLGNGKFKLTFAEYTALSTDVIIDRIAGALPSTFCIAVNEDTILLKCSREQTVTKMQVHAQFESILSALKTARTMRHMSLIAN